MKKNYFIKTLFLSFCLLVSNIAFAQLSITTLGTDAVIDFDSTVAGVNNGTYLGIGFNPTPAVGDLDGDAWEVTGFSSENHTYGLTSTTGDVARGASTGGVGTGGLYAFQVLGPNSAIGFQPSGSDFTPGTLTLKVVNNTVGVVSSINLSYKAYIYNDQSKSSNLTFSYSADNVTYTTVGALDVMSPTTADVAPAWVSTDQSTAITGLTLGIGATYYLRWSSDDEAGSGSRDELAIDDITVRMASLKTWDGPITNDNDWGDAANWVPAGIPDATNDVLIPTSGGTNADPDPVIDATRVVNNLTIEAGGRIYLFNNHLTVNGNMTNNSTRTTYITSNNTLDLAGSLIVKGDAIGPMVYFRQVPTDEWYLTSSPVAGATIQNIRANSSLRTNGTTLAFATYENTNNTWDYATTSSSGTIPSGKGHSVSRTAAGFITYNGSMPTTDVSIAITDETVPSPGNNYNLIGNPYPSYIPLNNGADAVNNILTVNTAELSEDTVWFWDESLGTDGQYMTLNQASGSRFISPGQGFFVRAKVTTGGTFAFTEAMQSHQTSEVFTSTSNNRFEINLAISNGTNYKNTEIYYIDGTTTGFDNGYDSSMFGATDNSFAVYTQLLSNNQGQDLAIQSLPDADYENMVIPVGVNATAGTEITFTANVANMPAGMDLYLEDRTANTFTKLNANGNYTLTLAANSNGIGQFYLRTSSSALGLENVLLDNVSIYKTSNTTIRIAGLEQGTVSVKVFNILGKQMLNKSFTTNGVSDVSLPKLATGIYIVQLQTENGKLNKKITVE